MSREAHSSQIKKKVISHGFGRGKKKRKIADRGRRSRRRRKRRGSKMTIKSLILNT